MTRWIVATRLRKIIVGVVVAASIPIAAFAWWLGSPLLFDTVVHEPFPLSTGALLPAGVTQEEAEQIMAEEASRDTVVDEPMAEPTLVPGDSPNTSPPPTATPVPAPTATATADRATEQTSPPSEPAATPLAGATPIATATPTPVPSPTPTATPAPAAVALQIGSFRDADRFHKDSGTATVYELPDGSLLLRLEDFNVTNGPDLHVLLSVHPDQGTRNEVKDLGYVDLGKLKGNIGNQNYEISAGLNVSDYSSVVIYCLPFHVLFSVAPLASAGA
jgi:hypothetical protein